MFIRQIDKNLKSDVRCMLEDPAESLKKFYKVAEFQEAQASDNLPFFITA
jgi:hypothetical protein